MVEIWLWVFYGLCALCVLSLMWDAASDAIKDFKDEIDRHNRY